MQLKDILFLFIDCQTTGMRPPRASMIEMAWAWGRASDPHPLQLHSKLIQLPEGLEIPKTVQDITGIRSLPPEEALTLPYLFSDFMTSFREMNQSSLAVIHYAQFEKPFLEDLFLQMTGEAQLPFRIFCSQKLSKKLLPQLPSQNLRGLVGYFGNPLHELKRASSHVQATFEIWQGLVAELEKQGVQTLEDLEKWIEIKPATEKVPYQYRISKEQRLSLPEKPGIYRMKSKSGQVLYVGKATSLKDRVNSYFRGRKGRDTRKLEMLTQVWDLEVLEAESALEAALLESDEIKKLNPPYNISLKARDRGLIFYSRDFESRSAIQNESHPIGPFRPNSSLEQIHILAHCLKVGAFLPVFYEPIDLKTMREGFEIFCEKHALETRRLEDVRALLAQGFQFLRKFKDEPALEESAPEENSNDLQAEDAPIEITAEEVADKFERLLMRGAQEILKARRLTRLLNAQVEWQSEVGWKTLHFQEGRLQPQEVGSWQPFPWQNLSILEYDRMSILWSEISRREHTISSDFSLNQSNLGL
jgi:DNA polymerase-3 subunit epsilon